MCVCVCVCAWVCPFRQKVNWVAAVVPETVTTGFVIAVTFLPAPLHAPGDGVKSESESAACGRMMREDEEGG